MEGEASTRTSFDIIVADDDPVVRHILGSVLRAGGHVLEEHPSGTALLASLKARTAVPDLLFLDLQLGDMTGAEVVPAVRQKFGRQTKIVILSANSADETRQLF